MYRSRGWMTHGYVDGFLDTRLPSGDELIWSDCISCGAWAALALWEDYCFTGNMTTLITELLPSFHGIAEFFMDHMTTLPGQGAQLFTGPSHSPENSYISDNKIHYLAFRFVIYFLLFFPRLFSHSFLFSFLFVALLLI